MLRSGNKESTKNWLQAKGYSPENLNEKKDNGATPLIVASREGEIDIVRDLLACDINLDLKNNDGNNALWFACFNNNLTIMSLLINAGIELNNQNDNGVTVLMYAASTGKIDAVKLLLKIGANPDLTNLDDFRAIDFASTREILNLLRGI